MIGYLQGVPIRITPEAVLLDVRGVGYEVHIPLSTFYEIERVKDRPVGLHIHTHVREDAIALFGFWTEREKLLFERLIATSGIGPRLARAILSGMPADELLAALTAGDVARLVRIPGVGRRTAERMVVDLKDKLQGLLAGAPAAAPPSPDEDLIEALLGLGYRRAEAERAVAAARRDFPDATFGELVKASLQRLSRA